jgi:hypothetical protein
MGEGGLVLGKMEQIEGREDQEERGENAARHQDKRKIE